MKHRISAVLLLSLMLSMVFMPLSVSADEGKSIIKSMVQAPEDYSVSGIAPIQLEDRLYRYFGGDGLPQGYSVFLRNMLLGNNLLRIWD